jgi:hypothetical protein
MALLQSSFKSNGKLEEHVQKTIIKLQFSFDYGSSSLNEETYARLSFEDHSPFPENMPLGDYHYIEIANSNGTLSAALYYSVKTREIHYGVDSHGLNMLEPTTDPIPTTVLRACIEALFDLVNSRNNKAQILKESSYSHGLAL